MSKPAVAMKQIGLLHFPGVAHFIVILIIAGIEVVGLVAWLRIHRGADLASVLGPFAVPQLQQLLSQVGRTAFAGIILGLFLLVEHIITQMDLTGKLSPGGFVEIFVFSVLEVIIWVIWLLLIPINGIVAFVFFLLTLLVEHQIADNVKKGLSFFHFSSLGSRVFRGLVVFTLFEVVGAVVWIITVDTPVPLYGTVSLGLTVLAVTSVIEHYIARSVSQIRD